MRWGAGERLGSVTKPPREGYKQRTEMLAEDGKSELLWKNRRRNEQSGIKNLEHNEMTNEQTPHTFHRWNECSLHISELRIWTHPLILFSQMRMSGFSSSTFMVF